MKKTTIYGFVTHETEKALLFEDGDNDFWVPKSQISNRRTEEFDDEDDITYVEVPSWLAERIAEDEGHCPVTDYDWAVSSVD